MPNWTHRAAWLLTLALATSAAGCTTPPAATTTPTPTITATASPTPSPTPTLTEAEQDLEDAKAAVVTMWATVDRLTNDPTTSIQDLDDVATGETLTMFQINLTQYRGAKWRGSGTSLVEELTAESDGVTEDGNRAWIVTACVDISNTTLVDQEGDSMQGPPYRVRHQSTVIERNGKLLVAEDEAVETC